MSKSPDVIKVWTDREIQTLRDPVTNEEAAKRLGRTVDSVQKKRKRLGIIGYPKSAGKTAAIPVETQLKVQVDLPKPDFGYLPLSVVDQGEWITVGLVGDTHLCCKEERLAELHNHYDLLANEGITSVFHAGNICDGYIARINGGSVHDSTIDGQCQYIIDNYPKRPGMKTYFITGDDHEGWWMKEGFNFGAYLAYLAKDQGRDDLVYIGHVEADVEIKPRGSKVGTLLKVQHPGGGSSYARSYTGQKQVESFEGGEKPAILIQGHYHVSNYMNDRNIHVVSLPGFQDQTIFARKKRLRMEIGGAILNFKVNPDDGAVTRCRVEFNRYFTRGYYKNYIKSDRKVLKGHLVLEKP